MKLQQEEAFYKMNYSIGETAMFKLPLGTDSPETHRVRTYAVRRCVVTRREIRYGVRTYCPSFLSLAIPSFVSSLLVVMEIQLSDNEVSCTLEEAGSNSYDLDITIKPEVVARELDRSFDHLKDQVEVPGFRKGNAPKAVIRKKYGEQVKEDLRKRLIEKSLQIAVEEQELEIVGEPRVQEHPGELSGENTFEYSVNVETKPEVEVGDYEDIEVTRPPVEVTDDEVEDALDNALDEHAELVWVEDGSTEKEDVIVSDLTLTIDGEEIYSDENIELTLDERLQIGPVQHPRLWRHFTGLEPGESNTIDLELPDEEQLQPDDFRGTTANVDLTVHEIKRPEQPELDDEFAQRYDCESVEELREDLREQIRNYKEQQSEEELHNEILDQLVEKADFELPERLLEQGHEHFLQQQKSRMEQAGIPEHIIQEKLHEQEDDSREDIRTSMKHNYVVEAVADREKIYVTESEVDEYIEQIASEQGKWKHELEEELEENDQMSQVRSELKEKKVMDFLIDHVSIQEEEEDE